MGESYDAAITALQQEIAERMRMVNSLCKIDGRTPIYADSDGGVAATEIAADQWYRAGLSTAVREFLVMRKSAGRGPATGDEIYAALVRGGFQFDAKDELNAKAAVKQSLTKNTVIFHRLPTGLYGLTAWYPGAKDSDEKERGRKRSKRVAKTSRGAAAKPVGGKEEKPESEPPKKVVPLTLRAAIKEAIMAMPGEFTKGEILDWINAKYPGLEAKKISVFSMIPHLREEMDLVGTPSTGREPSKYRRNLVAKD